MHENKTILEMGMEEDQAEKIEFEGMDYEQENNNKSNFFENMLKSETGEGGIEDYIQHPINFNNSKGMAQTIRGLTGLIGNLKLAVIDIFAGVLNMYKENKV